MGFSGIVRRTLPFGLLCSVLLFAGAPPEAWAQKKQPGVGYVLGDTAPELKLTDQYDNRVSLSDFRGQNVLLTFSAEWCGPCQAAAQISEGFVHKLTQKGEPTALVEVLVENDYGDPSETIDAQDWADAFNIASPVLSCGGDYDSPAITQFIEYSRRYGGPAYPTTVLLSPHGRIISAYVGFPQAKVEADFLQQRTYEERGMVDRLLTVVERMKLSADLTASLGDPLRAALDALDHRKWDDACGQLAAFADQVQAQADKSLTGDSVKQLTETARDIQEELGCE
jgi:thiol-disulfide isomerase/thioredoxin